MLIYLSFASALFLWIYLSSGKTVNYLSYKINPDLDHRVIFTEDQRFRCDMGLFFAQVIDDQSVIVLGNEGKLPCISNGQIEEIPTSFRWKPPAGELPGVVAIKFILIDSKTQSRSNYLYKTILPEKNNLPVFSIFIQPDDLFGFDRGIYVQGAAVLEKKGYKFKSNWWDEPANYHKRGKSWKRNAYYQFLDEKGNLLYGSDCLIAIHGNATRAYPQKSLRLSSMKGRVFEYDFFSNGRNSYKDIILRNGGNNWDKTFITDGYFHKLADAFPEMNLYGQDFQPCVVYINGTYWGIHNLRERFNEDHIASLFNVKKKRVTVIEGSTLAYGDSSEHKEFISLIDYCRNNDLTEDPHFKYIRSLINYNNFLNYLAFEIYAANTDWPSNNVKCFKVKDEKNALAEKWSWVIWDMDYCCGYTGRNAVEEDMFLHLENNSSSLAVLFNSMLKNSEFRKDLKKTFTTLFSDGLTVSFQKKIFNRYSSLIRAEMPRQIQRWRRPYSMDDWDSHLNNFIFFIENRQNFLMKQIDQYLKE